MLQSQQEAIVRSSLRMLGYSTDTAIVLAEEIARQASKDLSVRLADDKAEALEAYTRVYVKSMS
jgi:hypothetical protein